MPANQTPTRKVVRGAWNLLVVSLARQFRSRQTWICVLLLAFAALAVVAWSRHVDRSPPQFVDQILLGIYVSLLLPMICLCYGTAGIGADREEETLVYVLVSPLPRPVVYLAKLAAASILVVAWTLGSLALLCLLAGPAGRSAWWPSSAPILLASLAYTSLFHWFGAVWRRAALVGLAYTFFLEMLMGNVPGIAQRLVIAFHLRNLLRFSTGTDFASPATTLESLAPATSWAVLGSLTLAFLVAGTAWFARREY